MEGLRRRLPALLLAAALLSAADCTAGAEGSASAPPAGSLSAGSISAEPAPAENTPAGSTSTGSASSAQPPVEPLPGPDAAVPLPLPPEEDGDAEPSLAEQLFVPVAAAAVLLLAAVIWLVFRQVQGRKKQTEVPPPPFQGAAAPITRSPGRAPIYRVGNLHHIGQREEQQDSFCLSDIGDEASTREKGLLAVVADGMGGLEGGAAISQRVTDTFLARYRQLAVPDADRFLYDSVMAAEQAVEELMETSGVNGGSTVVAVLLRGDLLHFISVGDSRIYLLRGGQLRQLNHEHTYGALLRERAALGEVDPEEAYVNPRRDALTSYIGMGRLKRIDRGERPIPLCPGDKVLLCSDGVFNALGEDALAAALSGEAAQAAVRLEEAVLAQGLSNQDNFTGVVLELE